MQRQKITTIPLMTLVPSIITMFALCLGATAIRYAFDAKFDIAAALIMIASIMDCLDGRVARLLNSASDFGAQLDSLADLISFGVAPGIVVYLWSLHNIPYKGIGWAVVLFYISCSAFRLARFHVQLSDISKSASRQHFFTGVPMPAAAGLVLLPLIMTFNIVDSEQQTIPWLPNGAIAMYVVLIGVLMISKIPTFSGKKVHIKREYVLPLLVLNGVLITGILLDPWFMLPIIGIAYIASIPVSSLYYYKNYYKKSRERTY